MMIISIITMMLMMIVAIIMVGSGCKWEGEGEQRPLQESCWQHKQQQCCWWSTQKTTSTKMIEDKKSCNIIENLMPLQRPKNNVKAFDPIVLGWRNSTLWRFPQPIALSRKRSHARNTYQIVMKRSCNFRPQKIQGAIKITIMAMFQNLVLLNFEFEKLQHAGWSWLLPPDPTWYWWSSLNIYFYSPPHQENFFATLDLLPGTGQEHRLQGELQQLHHLLKSFHSHSVDSQEADHLHNQSLSY